MKTTVALGMFLALGLLICRSSAEELQWQRAPSSSSRIDRQGASAEPIGVMLSDPEPVPLNRTNFTSEDPAPVQFRQISARGTIIDDDGIPRPLPSGAQGLVPPPGVTQLAPTQPARTIVSGQVPPGGDQPLPIKPMLVPEGGTILLPRPPCNCGGGGGNETVIMDDGTVSSGSCCSDGCCSNGCCSDGCCCDAGCCGLGGWLASWRPAWLDGCLGGCCLDGCCMDGCCYNGNRDHFWITGEYLLYAFNRPNLPALVNTGTAGTPLPGAAGMAGLTTGPAQGQMGTQTLVGNNSFDNILHSGMRFDFGFWFPNCDKLGIDISLLYFPQISSTMTESGGIIGRPFLNVTPGNAPFQTTEAVNGFNGTTGTVNVNYFSRVWGLDANLRYKLLCCPNFRIDLLAGYRNFNLTEGVNVNENIGFFGVNNQITDSYNANNSFNGGQIGVDAEWRFLPRWSLGGQFKLAMGCNHESVGISGSTNIGNPAPIGVGFLAANTNIGNYTRDQFAVLPELNLKLGVDITRNIRIFVGYNLLFLSNAARAGDAIDTTVNTNNNQLFGPTGSPLRPAFAFSNSNFFAQGFSGGLDIHW